MEIIKKAVIPIFLFFFFFSFYYFYNKNEILFSKINHLEQKVEKLIKTISPTSTINPQPTINFNQKNLHQQITISPTQIISQHKLNWKLYQNNEEGFQFYYPANYELNQKIIPQRIPTNETYLVINETYYILNHFIYFIITNYSQIKLTLDCRGDCDVIESVEELTINNYPAKKIKAMVGAVGGVIPHYYIGYEIKFPNQEKYFFIALNSIEFDFSYHEQFKKYGERGKLQISPQEEKIFEEIVSTFKITK